LIDKNIYAPSGKSAKHGRTRIDDHIMLAGCILISCSFPTGLYFMAFHDFHGSQLPWKLAFSVQIVVPLILVIHYFANRRASRMWCEGVATSAATLGFWTIFGSCPFVYFGFAPMPLWERSAGLTGCLAGTLFWTIIVWRDHANYDLKLRLKQSLFIK
jgi:xanthine/uracil permease